MWSKNNLVANSLPQDSHRARGSPPITSSRMETVLISPWSCIRITCVGQMLTQVPQPIQRLGDGDHEFPTIDLYHPQRSGANNLPANAKTEGTPDALVGRRAEIDPALSGKVANDLGVRGHSHQVQKSFTAGLGDQFALSPDLHAIACLQSTGE